MIMQDPMSQMATAQRLTIPQLQQALRNGTIDPQVGQLVLNSKINEDKRRKAAMVATAAAQAPAQPPVTQQNLAYGAGVDGLPSNLPVGGTVNAAQGGILAFDEGGEVPRYANEGLATSDFDPMQSMTYSDYMKLTPAQKLAHQGKVLYRGDEDLKDPTGQGKVHTGFRAGINNMLGVDNRVNPPNPSAFYELQRGNTGLIPMTYEQYMTLNPVAKQQYVNQYGAPPARGAVVQNPLQKSIGINPPSKINQIINEGTPLRPQEQTQVPVLPSRATVVTQQPAAEKPSASIEDKLSQLNEYFGGAGNAAAGSRTKGTPGIGGFSSKGYEVKPYTAARKEMEAALADEMNLTTGKPYTYEEKAAERKARQEAAGIDFNLYGKQREELEGKKNLSDTRSRLNEAMPFFEAASLLGQAPKPGETTMTAFSRALAGAGKTKAEIMDKEEARQERIGDKLNALAVAQNQFNAAQFSGNEADLKEARNAIKASRKDLRDLGIKETSDQNEMAKTMAELRSKENIAAMQESGAWARLGKENATIQAITKAILNDNPNMSLSDAINKAYLTKSAGSVYGADTRANTAQITALANQKKDLLKSRPLLSTAVPAWEKQIKDIEKQIEALGGSAATAAPTIDTSGFVDKTKY